MSVPLGFPVLIVKTGDQFEGCIGTYVGLYFGQGIVKVTNGDESKFTLIKLANIVPYVADPDMDNRETVEQRLP